MEENYNRADQLLSIMIDGRNYALPVEEVAAVIPLRRSAICPVPFDCSGRIRGVFNHKGQVIALIRHPELIAAVDRQGAAELTAVILSWNGKLLALAVDRAAAVTDTPPEDAQLLRAERLYNGAEGI